MIAEATPKEEWEEFAAKMNWEGGVAPMLYYGGSVIFPSEVRTLAESAAVALNALQDAVDSQLDQHDIE